MRVLIYFTVLLALTAPPALAASAMTLAELRDMCTKSDKEGQAACRFYILGAFQGLGMAGAITPGAGGQFIERTAGKTFCVPDDLSQSAMVEKVVSFANADLKAFPDDANMPAISFVGSVVTKSYPCR